MSIQTSDPVADLITRIRNAIAVGKTEIRVPTSKLKLAVAEKLQKIHYLEKVEIEETAPRNILHIVINKEDSKDQVWPWYRLGFHEQRHLDRSGSC